MFHASAFYQDFVGSVSSYLQINAIDDQVLYTNGKDLRVADGYEYLMGIYPIRFHTAIYETRITSATLRMLSPEYALFGATSVVWLGYPSLGNRPQEPIRLTPGESIRSEVRLGAADSTARGQFVYVLLGGGRPVPVQSGYRRVRATTPSQVMAIGAWQDTTLEWEDELPYGKYQIIGAHFGQLLGTPIFARIMLPGQSQRPGNICVPLNESVASIGLTGGEVGVWGEFDLNQPPSLQVMVGAASATRVSVTLDVVRTGM
jgi:hypothetical protein